jgi:C-terminal processing protease CtpA/Prc
LLAWILKRRAKTRADKKAVKRIRLKEGQTLTLRVNRSEDWEVK